MNRRYRKTIVAGNWKMHKLPGECKHPRRNQVDVVPEVRIVKRVQHAVVYTQKLQSVQISNGNVMLCRFGVKHKQTA